MWLGVRRVKMTILQGVFESIRAKKPVVAPQAFIDDLVALQKELARGDGHYCEGLEQGKLGADDHLKALKTAINSQSNLIHLNKKEVWVLPAFFTVLQTVYTASAIRYESDVMRDNRRDAEAHRQASAMSMVTALMNVLSDLIVPVDKAWAAGLKNPFHIADDVRLQVKQLYKAFSLNPSEHSDDAREVSWLFMYGPTEGCSKADGMSATVMYWRPSPLSSNATVLALAVAVGIFAAGYMAVQSISSSDDMSMAP